MSEFSTVWSELEKRFRRQAAKEGGVYLPNPKPSDRVDHILIAMEPSLGFARGDDPDSLRQNAQRKINSRQQNFLYSMEDFLLHYAVRKYLCAGGETYHVTDVCKTAMRVKDAQRNRFKRYDPWYPLLEDEISLVSKPCASIWAIGLTLRKYLPCLRLPQERFILHYGAQAGAARLEATGGRESVKFQSYLESEKVSLEDVLKIAEIVLDGYHVPDPLKSETLKRLGKTKQLSPSRLRLLFHYSTKFKTERQEWCPTIFLAQ
ncbi:MAG: hypothetical protein WCB27_20440 [Thermoguttaceae bacterium]